MNPSYPYLTELKLVFENRTARRNKAQKILSRVWSEKYGKYFDHKDGSASNRIECVFGSFDNSFSFYNPYPPHRSWAKCGIEILGLTLAGKQHSYHRGCMITIQELKAACKQNAIKVTSKTKKLDLIRALLKV